jgi:hypothetical protein
MIAFNAQMVCSEIAKPEVPPHYFSNLKATKKAIILKIFKLITLV